MADNPTAPFNEDALASRVASTVVGALSERAQQAAAAQQQAQAAQRQQQAAQQAQQQAGRDPVYTAIAPYIEPALRQMNVQTQGALDAVGFYAEHPEALRHRAAIEGQFNEMAGRGMPFDRSTIFNHYKGANFDAFAKEQQEAMQQRAAYGATVGAPGVGRPGGLPVLDAALAKTMPFEDLERAVKGRMF